ncbi:MAG: polyprenyl synthetase family protein [Gammaproteobacteria bacterium]|nr:polyprenyl synthetase family protein [Gammaproteobacteria bacterium]NIR84483.1 polyprenyl synthetase family protein [Gammaproteobacteria bacterium]NIR90386.1 polyprenyl synthetase family protein [Gammaproteobacteria bacterium]NIU05534.1 polyprenyl synthetase family protein [Gammaproteobacteria bacterium]NIV52673.1 polyprenyl synthetase family protein [Gammaproteobacteria bacterium]
MDFLGYWHGIRDRIDAECAAWIPEFFEGGLPAEHEAIHASLAAGKRLRGCLVCLMCEALGGRLEAAIPRAVAIECIQAASLMHDDYVDDDRQRRGQAATWTVQGARRAVLLADVMFATAIRRMVELDPRDGAVVTRAIVDMARGAYQELHGQSTLGLALEAGTYRSDEYLTVIRRKSGSLFGAAAQLGALAANADTAAGARALEFGMRIGDVYQMADDLTEITRLARTDAPRDVHGAWALAPALLYFSDATPETTLALLRKRGEAPDASEAAHLRAAERAMRLEMAVRVDEAIAVLDRLSASEHTRLLREMPAAMMRLMEPQPAET